MEKVNAPTQSRQQYVDMCPQGDKDVFRKKDALLVAHLFSYDLKIHFCILVIFLFCWQGFFLRQGFTCVSLASLELTM